jgi:hypothetical protein
MRGATHGAICAAAVGWSMAACGNAPAAPEARNLACADARTLTCTFFDGTNGTWSAEAPTGVSMARACGPGGAHGEIDAFVDTQGQYWLDRLGFQATGSAVRVAPLGASDDAGGATYGCGTGGGKVLTQLLCGKDVGTGTLALRFTFAGHWADGTAWSKDCDANIEVTP